MNKKIDSEEIPHEIMVIYHSVKDCRIKVLNFDTYDEAERYTRDQAPGSYICVTGWISGGMNTDVGRYFGEINLN